MKKYRKIAVSAVSLAALTLMAAHFNMSDQTKVNAKISEETADVFADSINDKNDLFPDFETVDDSGYFADTVDYYRSFREICNMDHYVPRDRYITYCGSNENQNGDTMFLLIFPDAKMKLTLPIARDGKHLREEITEKVLAVITDGEADYDTYDEYTVISADEITHEQMEKVREICKPYIEDGYVIDHLEDDDLDNVIFMSFYASMDKLWYRTDENDSSHYDFEAMAEFLKDQGENCRVTISRSDDGKVTCSVEPEKDTIEEKLRIAKMIDDKFGYMFSAKDYTVSLYPHINDYSEVNLIPADYLTPKEKLKENESKPDEVEYTYNSETPNIVYDKEIYGDLNYDKKVDVTDLSLLSLCLIHDKDINDSYILEMADVKSDGKIDIADLATLRQYVSKKIEEIGKFSGLKDITDQCVTIDAGGAFERWNNGIHDCRMISSMDEYSNYIDIGPSSYSYRSPGNFENLLLEKTGLEVNDEFFENHRLAVLTDNSQSINGVGYDLKSVKVNDRGDVNLYYDHIVPDVITCLGGVVYHVTVVPGNPKNDCQTYVHFNEEKRYESISGYSIINSTEVLYDGTGDYPESTGIIASMDEYREQILDKGIDPYAAVKKFGISEEFFESNFLAYSTFSEPTSDSKYRIYNIGLENKNNLILYVDNFIGYGGEMKYWFLGVSVPKSSINPIDLAEVKTYVGSHLYSRDNISDMGENSVISVSDTEFVYDPDDSGAKIIDSFEEFEELNKKYGGKYSHISDELLYAHFFDNNVLMIINQPAEKSNFRYSIHSLNIGSNGNLEVDAVKCVNREEKSDDDSTEWHLAAAISRKDLVYGPDDVKINVTHNVQEAIAGKYE